MKRKVISIAIFLIGIGVKAQNTFPFPENDNVGIGTKTPRAKLEVNGKTIANSLSLKGINSINSVSNFANRIEFTDVSTGAIVFNPGKKDELMFGFHQNGNFYWGTGKSATKPDYYSMYLNGNNGDLNIRGKTIANSLSLKGINSINSVSNFANRIEFTDVSTGAIVFNPGKKDELMFGFHQNGNFYWGTGKNATKPGYYSMSLNGNNGDLNIRGKAMANSLSLKGVNSSTSVNNFANKIEFTGGANGALVFNPGKKDELMFGLHQNGNFYWGTGRSATKPNYYSMYLNGNNGDLGIKGKLTSNEVKVKLGGWADFVFEDKYELPTLKEVENHIKEKGHLKDIPSAKDVSKNGIYLGEMNAKLLQKIEELTLYTIQQEKKIKQQEKELKKLKVFSDRLDQVEKMLKAKK